MASLMETLEDLARRAGEITLRHFQTALEVEKKSDESPVTIADRNTETFLREEIGRLFPDDAVVGEEFGETGGKGESRRRWIIDPIDGTKSFVHGVPLYGVMIGVEEDERIVAGVVNLPALNEIVVAGRGRGCWWNGRRAHVSCTARISEALLLTTDIRHHYQYGHGPSWDRMSAAAGLVRTWGDCYGHILVATGRADIMLDAVTSSWDCAPLMVILEEAGGTFTDYDGVATIHGKCAISTNGALFDQVMQLARR